jgi:hypothetical protein
MCGRTRPRGLGDQTQRPSFFSLLGAPPGATERRSIAPPGLGKQKTDGCRAFPGLAAGASISSNLNPRVPRLRRSATVPPFDAEHGCKQRSRGTRIIKVDGILERSPPLAGLTGNMLLLMQNIDGGPGMPPSAGKRVPGAFWVSGS